MWENYLENGELGCVSAIKSQEGFALLELHPNASATLRNRLNNCFLLTFTFFFACPYAFHFQLCTGAYFQRLLQLGLQTTVI